MSLIVSPKAILWLWTFSELRESDRYPKDNTPFRGDWRISVINHPLSGNIKVQWWQTGTNHHSADSQAQR